jgi:hypothetical protein
MTTSTEPLLPSSLPSSSDGAAVGFAVASGDGLIIVAAASETIARNWNDRNNGDDGDDGGGGALAPPAVGKPSRILASTPRGAAPIAAIIDQNAVSTCRAWGQ